MKHWSTGAPDANDYTRSDVPFVEPGSWAIALCRGVGSSRAAAVPRNIQVAWVWIREDMGGQTSKLLAPGGHVRHTKRVNQVVLQFRPQLFLWVGVWHTASLRTNSKIEGVRAMGVSVGVGGGDYWWVGL